MEQALAGRTGNFHDLADFMRTHYVPLRAPLVLISQAQRSGGSLLSQLFDSHPVVAAYPQELRFNSEVQDHWPAADPALGADANLRLLLDSKFPELVRKGLSKGRRNRVRHRFALIPYLQGDLFRQLWSEKPPASSRTVMDYFFTAFFNSWLDYRGDLEQKTVIVAFSPRMARAETSVKGYFETYPDGRLIQIIRDPRSWYPSAGRAKRRMARKDAGSIIEKWRASAESILRNRSHYGEKVIVLRFEDLIARTEATMRELARSLDLAFDPTLLRPTINGRAIVANSSFEVESAGIVAAPLTRDAMLSRDERQLIERKCLGLYDAVLPHALAGASKDDAASVERTATFDRSPG